MSPSVNEGFLYLKGREKMEVSKVYLGGEGSE